MRRSRVAPAPFVAGLLIGLIAAVWLVYSLDSETPVATPPQPCAPTTEAAPQLVAPLPATEARKSVAADPCPRERYVETPGYPDERVRVKRLGSIPPDELYAQNRVILRKVACATDGQGLQISGEVLTDFFCDRSLSMPQGQLLGLQVNVELYHYDTVIQHDPRTGQPHEPRIDPQRTGTLIEGQSTTVKVSKLRGDFAVAGFKLPWLDRPLAPGVYRLIASVRFKTQTSSLREAIRWCSDLYGARPEVDDNTLKVTFQPVMANADLHNEVYHFLIETLGVLVDEAHIHVGRVLEGGTVGFIPPEFATSKCPANIVIRDYHSVMVEQVWNYEDQLDNTDTFLATELDKKEKALDQLPQTEDRDRWRNRWRTEAVEEATRIRRDNGALIEKYGGRLDEAERKMHEHNRAARTSVLKQIADFQDRLALQYWIMCDGVIQYTGWNSIYRAGYDTCIAVENGELPQPVMPALQPDKWPKRREQWKYVPEDLTDVAFEYLRREEETDVWHPAHFTSNHGGSLRLDVAKWSKLRNDWLAEFKAAADQGMASLDTTGEYAVQVWPGLYRQLSVMNEETMLLAWSWEFYIRTHMQQEATAGVIASWTDAPKSLKDELAKRATVPPGTVKTRFDVAANELRSAVLRDFMGRWSKAIRAGVKPPGRE